MLTAVEQAQRLQCPGCKGDKYWVEGEPEHEERHPCPFCQDETNTPTGLIFWWLTKKCDFSGCENGTVRNLNYPGSVKDCPKCGGTGRVPRSDAEVLALLMHHERFKMITKGYRQNRLWFWAYYSGGDGNGPTIEEALAAALLEAYLVRG